MPQTWKTVRIFISSTFRDMHAERDHLVRIVFPELKERCRKMHVHVIDVDLRWGVTETDAEHGKALDICLDEIDSCRPYFLGLLGHRYGWIPPGETHSITAQEIYHGVLHSDLPRQVVDLRKILEGKLEGKALSDEQRNCLTRCYEWDADKRKYLLRTGVTPEEEAILCSVFEGYSIYQKDRSFFLFRKESLTRKLAGEHVDDFFESKREDQEKLAALKEEIVAAGLRYFEYDDIEAFGQLVLEELWKKIEAEVERPAEKEKDWLEEEAEFHELFMADRTRRFVGRRELLDRMQRFCESDDEPRIMLITGEPGCGKSALMARFAEKSIHKHPDWLIIPHFVGASPASTAIRRTLRRLCAQIYKSCDLEKQKQERLSAITGNDENASQQRAEIEKEFSIPEDFKELVLTFPDFLKKASGSPRIIIVIDAVNQFEKLDNAHLMRWLPQEFPTNVRCVISTLPGEARDAILARRTKPLEETVKGLTKAEVEELVKTYLKEIQHEFPNRQVEQAFFDKVKSGNPLYILVALEELRVFGQFEKLADRVGNLPDSVPALFDQVLERIEGDFNPALVRDCMSYIACGRHGMTAEEMQTLLKAHAPRLDPKVESDKLPDMLWARLYRAFSPYLFERSDVIDFFHGQLKDAVGKRYLQEEAKRETVHKIIADYFETRWHEPYHRALNELPHHRTKARDWEGAKRILCDLKFIEAKCTAGMAYELVTDYQVPAPKYQVVVAAMHGEALWSGKFPISEFSRFMQNQAHILAEYPSLTFQQAANQPDTSPVAATARRRWAEGKETREWLQWVNKPQHPDPCIMTLKGESPCAYSPDGKRIVSASGDNTLKIWDAETGAEIRTLTGHSNSVRACAYSPDGKRIISASYDKTLKIWDAESGAEIRTLTGHSNRVQACAYSPDGKRLVSASGDNTLKIWDPETGAEIRTLAGHSWDVNACSYSPDGKHIVSASHDQTLKIWDAESGAEIRTLAGHSYFVYACSYSPDGNRIVSVSSPQMHEGWELKIWDAETGAEIRTLTGHSKWVRACAYSPDGKHIVSASDDNALKIWDAETGADIATLTGHSGVLTCAYSPDGKRIVSASGGTLKIWDAETGTEVRTLRFHGTVSGLCYSPDGKCLLSASNDNALRTWSAKTGAEIRTLTRHSSRLFGCAYSPDGKYIVSASDDKTLKIFDAESGAEVRTLRFFGKVKGLCYSPDGKHLITASVAMTRYTIFDAKTRAQIGIITDYDYDWRRHLSSFSTSAGGPFEHLVEISSDSTLKIWDTETGVEIRTLTMHSSIVNACAYSPDGKHLVSASDDTKLKIWNAETGAEIMTLTGHSWIVNACAYSPDGKRIVSASHDHTLKIWDAGTGAEIRTITGHSGDVLHCAYSSDGNRIVSVSSDGTLKIWDAETGTLRAVFVGGGLALAIGAGGQFIAVGNPPGGFNILQSIPPILSIPLTTLIYLYRSSTRNLDMQPTAKCEWCGQRFTPGTVVIDAIHGIARNAKLSLEQSPCVELPDEAWEEPRLLSECPYCHKALKFNPFIVDNRYCWHAPSKLDFNFASPISSKTQTEVAPTIPIISSPNIRIISSITVESISLLKILKTILRYFGIIAVAFILGYIFPWLWFLTLAVGAIVVYRLRFVVLLLIGFLKIVRCPRCGTRAWLRGKRKIDCRKCGKWNLDCAISTQSRFTWR
jgi:WD40 repeat protein